METFYFEKTSELKREFENIKRKLNVSMILKGRQLTIDGGAVEEFLASRVLSAMSFGFSAKKALMLLEENMDFRVINIKDFTRRKNMYDVRSRVIGKEGKTKDTIENISGCYVELSGNDVGIIGSFEAVEVALTALKNIVRGSKQSNVYSYLERMNTVRKKLLNDSSDLGLKYKKKEI